MPRLFPRFQELTDYEHFFNDYENQFRKEYQDVSFFSEHHCGIEEAKAALLLSDDNLRKALRCYIVAFRSVCEMAIQAGRSFRSQEDIENELNTLYMRKLATLASITDILKRIRDIPEATYYALTLSTHIRNIHEACEVYEIIIEQTKDISEKVEKLGEYADYCLEWGRYEKANLLLQCKLSLERQSFENYMATIKKLTVVAMDRSRYNDIYQDNLANWTRLPEEDVILNGYLEELELIVPEE